MTLTDRIRQAEMAFFEGLTIDFEQQSRLQPHNLIQVFGPWSRFAVVEGIDRFGLHYLAVTDAEAPDPVTGRPSMIRQVYSPDVTCDDLMNVVLDEDDLV